MAQEFKQVVLSTMVVREGKYVAILSVLSTDREGYSGEVVATYMVEPKGESMVGHLVPAIDVTKQDGTLIDEIKVLGQRIETRAKGYNHFLKSY